MTLSSRQLEAVRLAARGLSDAEIATRMGISIHTVKQHLEDARHRLGAANRTEAAVIIDRQDRAKPRRRPDPQAETLGLIR